MHIILNKTLIYKFIQKNHKGACMKKLLLTLVGLMFIAGAVVQLPYAYSKKHCAGLKKTKCEQTKDCQWITPKDKTAYCRAIPEKEKK